MTNSRREAKEKTMNRISAAIVLALPLLAGSAMAEVTQDCIVEGTVDKDRAEKMGKPVYVEFHTAKRGEEARCTMNESPDSIQGTGIGRHRKRAARLRGEVPLYRGRQPGRQVGIAGSFRQPFFLSQATRR